MTSWRCFESSADNRSPPSIRPRCGRRIGDRSNLVVAAAAAIAGENGLVELAKDLEGAFDRLLVQPLKDDKLCRAELVVVQAGDGTPGSRGLREGSEARAA